MATVEYDLIGVKDVASIMGYTEREAWEFVRKIGVVAINPESMKLARFSRAKFDEAMERSARAVEPRRRTGALAPVLNAEKDARAKVVPSGEAVESPWRARLKKA